VKARIHIPRAAVALMGAALMLSVAILPAAPPARRFVSCYQALGRSAEPLSAWERLTFSYVLARGGWGEKQKERADLAIRPLRP
jgi:hypothetical protein